MTLKTYCKKRNFQKTPEPKDSHVKNEDNHTFVVQKHAASHLHYDFRLELQGVLKSWAIPKGPCLDPSIKRLAIEVEDHPLSYRDFEGVIPQGEYGGGKVIIWDKGTWASEENLIGSYDKGNMHFTLHGQKLKGSWKLIRTSHASSKPQWLLIKINDFASQKLSQYDITTENCSVVTNKNLDEMLPLKQKIIKTDKKKISLPKNFRPELATLVKEAPIGREWLHEIKYDGYRILAFIEEKDISLISRNNQDWTKKFLAITNELKKLKLRYTILDGEIVALNAQGRSDFQLLQNSFHQAKNINLHYFIFDLPFYQGEYLLNKPLIERKKILKRLISSKVFSHIHYSDHIIGNGGKLFRSACQQKLEGIVSKRINSYYQQNRTEDWLKVKCIQRQEFIIIGFTDPQGTRKYFGSLLLAYYDAHQKLVYCGHVGTGFTMSSLKFIYHKLEPFLQKETEVAKHSSYNFSSKVHWVKPQLIAEIEFSAWTKDGLLRHPSFKGLREDKFFQEIKKETAISKSLFNQKISHPDKLIYPNVKVTKLAVVNYCYEVMDFIFPYIQNRPLTLRRCPNEVGNKCFYQKNWIESLPKEFSKIEVETKSGLAQFIYMNSKEGVIAAAQLNVLEIHPWQSRNDKLNQPDQLIFDLDPSPEVKWPKLLSAAIILRDALSLINLKSFVKLTGGKGLHIVAPINRAKKFQQIKIFAKAFSEQLALNFPKIFTTQLTKQARTNKIFIDYLRNDYGSTTIAAFSLRANEAATIAVPITWEKLEQMKKLEHYTIQTWQDYKQEFSEDPWENFFKIKQNINNKHFQLLNCMDID